MFCSQCGNDVENASFCNQCGTQIANTPPPQPEPPQPEPPPPEPPPEQEPQPEPPKEEAPPEPESQPELQPEPQQEAAQPEPEIQLEAPPPVPMQAAPPPAPPPLPPPAHHPHHPPQPYQYHQHPQHGFVGDVYSKAFGFLFQKPVLLWGLSVLFSLLTLLAMIFGVFPLIWLPIVLVLELGMINIFLRGFRGHPISATLMFEGFNKFLRNAGGMGWRTLWLLIWGLVPIAGIVKFYSYRFVPYIMLNDPDIPATEALKKSMVQTNGYKGKMFLADLIIYAAVVVVSIIFSFIMRVHFIGVLLAIIYHLLLVALLPLIAGTLEAVYYDKISRENPIE